MSKRVTSVTIIVRTLYGTTTSTERFTTMLVDSLRTIVFVPSRFDRDFYVRLRNLADGFDFICTHVGDLKILAKDPDNWIEYIASVFFIKEHNPQQYYLYNDCRDHGDQDM